MPSYLVESYLAATVEGVDEARARARRTAELHGGTLTLSSLETGGSAFTLRLPIHALSHLDERTA